MSFDEYYENIDRILSLHTSENLVNEILKEYPFKNIENNNFDYMNVRNFVFGDIIFDHFYVLSISNKELVHNL